jgi:hypothetical protein
LIEASSLPLQAVESDFAVDSSGFSTCRFAQSEVRRQENDGRHEWIKVHLMCGVKTNIVTSIEVTDSNANDYPQFEGLVKTTGRNFTMNQVSADKAYLSSNNLQESRAAQINEALGKVLAHNLCCLIQSIYELGIEPTFLEGVA